MKDIKDMNLAEAITALRDVDVITRGYQCNYEAIEELADRIHDLTRWIPVSEKFPTAADADESGKVMIYRITTKSQRASAKSLYDWGMVKTCHPDETWWMPLPKDPITPPEGV
jgi:hypothetical protein